MARPGVIEAYLRALRAALCVPPGIAEEILCEVEAHLREDAAREVARGALPEEAERIATRRFGLPDTVARAWMAVYAGFSRWWRAPTPYHRRRGRWSPCSRRRT